MPIPFGKFALLFFVTCLGSFPDWTVKANAQVTPYGSEIDRFDRIAYEAEEALDFDTAIINYRRSLEVARNLQDPLLRTCGIAGAEARLRRAEAQKQYISGQLRPDATATVREARRIGQMAFDAYWEQFDRRNPDLSNGCP